MISVIIPLYNKEKQIAKTLYTVLQQTFQKFEIIIINDGSTDSSVKEITQIKDLRIRLINQENAGVSVARNRGIKEARYDLIAFLDADDEWKPQYLEMQYKLYQKYSECNVYACGYEFKDTSGNVSNTIIRKLSFQEKDGILENYFEVASCSHPPLWTSAIMVKKQEIQRIGGFPIGVKSGEDLLTWAKLAVNNKIAYTTSVQSVFCIEGYKMSDKPKRIPAENDIVGKELREMLHKTSVPYLAMYLSHWHKMRSSIYMRLNMRMKSICEAAIGLKYNPLNYKLYIYILLNLISSKIRPF